MKKFVTVFIAKSWRNREIISDDIKDYYKEMRKLKKKEKGGK